MKNINLYIPLLIDNLDFVLSNLDFYYKNLPIDNIFLVGNKNISDKLPNKKNLFFIDENEVFNGMTLGKIKDLINLRNGNIKRAGWYFQQFLKMALVYKIGTYDKYLVWDADTLPINPIEFISPSNKLYLTEKKEFHKPYFNTMSIISNGLLSKFQPFSFIAEHMLIDVNTMKDLIKLVEYNKNLPFYEIIINSIDKNDLNFSGFSEFETFGTYALKFTHIYETRKLRTLREGIKFLGRNPNPKLLKWASNCYDIISFERNDKVTFFHLLINLNILRKGLSLKKFVKFRLFLRRIYRFASFKNNLEFD